MKPILLCFFTLAIVKCTTAQPETFNWYFGSNVGLNFAVSPPAQLTGSALHTYEGCAAISDSLGNLLFYTDGVTVWNSQHSIMPNGTGLYGHSSSSQSATIVPLPGSSTIYYIFTAPEIMSTLPLAYSIVDMNMNGGLGAVALKNAPIINSSTEKLAAVKHANSINYWIIAHPFPGGDFHSYLLTSTGLNMTPVISTVGNSLTNLYHKIGNIKASPCGSKVAMSNYGITSISTLELFDFDNSTGQLSNTLLLGTWNNTGVWGIEFSPDNSKLYLAYSGTNLILQYDLSSGVPATIIASADTIGNSGAILGALQLAPDGKIYVGKYSQQSLGCITAPNNPGNACNYNDLFVTLTDSCFLGLPNFVSSYFCDVTSSINEPNLQGVKLYPNPFAEQLNISLSASHNLPVTIVVYDVMGREVWYNEKLFESIYELDTSPMNSGVYFVEIRSEDGKCFREKVMKGKY